QRLIVELMRHVLPAGEEPHKSTALSCGLVANCPAQHGIGPLDGVKDRALGHGAREVKGQRAIDAREVSQMEGQDHLDHGSVCTSTDSTAGRSRTMAVQVSPLSAEAYTCPPVVPKYTPHDSSESTAIASRSTFT